MPKVTEIVNPSVKTGTSPNGKEWVMKEVRTDDGKVARTFDEVAVGDEVELTYNEQYKNWSAKKPTRADKNFTQIMAELTAIKEVTNKILVLIQTSSPALSVSPPPEAEPAGKDHVLTDEELAAMEASQGVEDLL